MGLPSSDWREEKLTEQFYAWELRGRGWQVFDEPVALEPPFRPFSEHRLPRVPSVDDGRQETFLSSLVNRFRQRISPEPTELPDETDEEEEPAPDGLERTGLVELAISLPKNHSAHREAFEQFLFNLSLCREPIAFELLATRDSITPQFAVHPSDALLIRRQLAAYFPEAVLTPQKRMLEGVWNGAAETAIVDFGLADEFMLPLLTGKMDLFIGLASALAELEDGEAGLFQVLFQPVSHPWAESILRAVTDGEGGSFFANRPELLTGSKQKLARPLYAAVVRLGAVSDDPSRVWEIIQEMAGALSGVAHPHGNELMPLRNDDYPLPYHAEDVCLRQSRRSGMLLNSDELMAFVHLPSQAVATSKLARQIRHTKAAPTIAVAERGVLLGQNIHGGKIAEVRLSPEQRTRHMHIIGASGTGKSTLLFNLIKQDIENGQGVAVVDPHGDLIEKILGLIPAERIEDVVLLDPSDEEFSVGFNILSAHSDLEKTVLSSDLISVFERLSTSWGDQMSAVLRNAILAFLESDQGGTLADLRRFLIDPAYRASFLESVSDPEVVYYWRKAFPQLTGNKSIGPVVTRLDSFLSPKPIRFMVSQRENKLDFSRIMDERKIFLAKLPQGEIGEENSYLLGSLLVAKFQQAAMSRQRLRQEDRNFFSLYLDEFHHFITPSLAEMLSGARKYRVALVLAHHELRQLERDSEVASAVLSNTYTRIVYRLGDADAKKLSEGFSFFGTEDIQGLGTGEAICRVERSDFDFNLSVPLPEEPDAATVAATRHSVIEASRRRYGARRSEVEEKLREALYTSAPAEKKERVPKAATPVKPEPEPQSIDTQPVSKPAPPVPQQAPPSQPEKPQSVAPATAGKDAEGKALLAAGSESKPETSLSGDLGRGGVQHQAIQQRLKAVAENLGYKATIEKMVLDGQGSIDLVLEKARGGSGIACEINVTSTVDHEVGNVTKCLKAGFSRVAVICPRSERLARLEEAVNGCLAPDQSKQVGFYSPDSFITFLQNVALEEIQTPAEAATAPEIRRGYKVKRSFVGLSPEESKAREDAAFKMIAEKMRKKVKSGS